MPENDTTAEAGESAEPTFNAPSSQEELDRIIQKRLDREREKFADYGELKAQAEKHATEVADLREANKQLSERVEQFEQESARAALVKQVADRTGVPADLLTASTEEELTAQAERLAKWGSSRHAPVIEGQADAPSKVVDDPMREFTRNLFKTSDRSH